MSRPRFHLAIPVHDLDEAAGFYGEILGSPRGRSADTWIDWDVFGLMREHFSGPLILNVGFSRAQAAEAVASGRADLVAFGQHYIANPDLVERFRDDHPLNRPHVRTYYSQGEDGYIDYSRFADSDPELQQDADLPVRPVMPG